MTDKQQMALHALRAALDMCTKHAVLDELAVYIHPDIINRFCDAVNEMENENSVM